MEYRTLLGYYRFGTVIRYLQDCRPTFRVHGESLVLANLDALFRNLETLGLPVTQRVAQTDLEELKQTLETCDEDEKIGDERSKTLKG